MKHRWMIGAAVLSLTVTGQAIGQDAEPQMSALCISSGVSYGTGEYACISACHGERRLARCDVSTAGAQVTEGAHDARSTEGAAWTFLSDACPSVMIDNPPWPYDWNEIPVTANMTPRPLQTVMSAISPDIAPRVGSRWPALIR